MDYEHMMRGDSARAIDRTREIRAENAMIETAQILRQQANYGYNNMPRGFASKARGVLNWCGAFLIVVTVFWLLNILIMS